MPEIIFTNARDAAKAAMRNYMAAIAKDAGQKFADTDGLGTLTVPTRTHAVLIDLIKSLDVTNFLSKINFPMVHEVKGELLFAGMDTHVLKRTNVNVNPREATAAASVTPRNYELFSTEADMLLSWDKLDAYAYVPNFQETIRNLLVLRIAEDRLYVGWQGVDELADVATAAILNLSKGWIQSTREDRAANVISEIVPNSSKIFVGNKKVVVLDEAAATDQTGGVSGLPATAHGFLTGAEILVVGTANYNGKHLVRATSTVDRIDILKAYAIENIPAASTATQNPDYANLDELASEIKASIPASKRNGLTAMLSDDLYTDQKSSLYKAVGSTPSEKAQIERAAQDLAAYPVEPIPLMPPNTLVLTSHSNLSIYVHANWRRNIEMSDARKGVVLWNEFKDDYIVEDYDKIMIAENIFRI